MSGPRSRDPEQIFSSEGGWDAGSPAFLAAGKTSAQDPRHSSFSTPRDSPYVGRHRAQPYPTAPAGTPGSGILSATGPGPSGRHRHPGNDPADQRRAVVEQAAQEWRTALIDVSATNRLLFFKPNAATLDLTAASPGAVTELLQGRTVATSRLFSDPKARAAAEKSCRALARKEQEAQEEYGVSVTFLALGLATWQRDQADGLTAPDEAAAISRPRATPLAAPVLLRAVTITIRRGSGTVDLTLSGDAQLNTVLAHVMSASYGVSLDEETILQAGDDTAGELEPIFDQVRKQCAAVDRFSIDSRLVLGVFSYLKQPMVSDVENLDALARSNLASALAGDPEAVAAVRTQRGSVHESDPDYAPVETEHLVLDADASQSYVVNAALAGRSMVVEGPPGTGKSQTIANVIAALAADGKRVLFVAQKRAAITAVLDRLDAVGLGDITLDLFAATSSRRYVAEKIKSALESSSAVGRPNTYGLHHGLTTARSCLVEHRDALHAPSRGWGVSVADLYAAAHDLPAAAAVDLRLPASTLTAWAPGGLDARIRDLEKLAAGDGLAPDRRTRPGWAVPVVTSDQTAEASINLLLAVRGDLLPQATATLETLGDELGITPPATPAAAEELLHDLVEATSLLTAMPGAFDLQLEAAALRRLVAATNKKFAKEHGAKLSWGERRRAEREARALVTGPVTGVLPTPPTDGKATGATLPLPRLHGLLRQVEAARAAWAAHRLAGPVRPLDSLQPACDAFSALLRGLAQLDGYLQNLRLTGLPFADVERWLGTLLADRTLRLLPHLHQVENSLREAGLGRVLDTLRTRVDLANQASDVLRHVAVHSALEHALATDPVLASATGERLHAATADFQRRDTEHLQANAARVRRAVAEGLVRTLDAQVEQHQLVRRETRRRRGAIAVRQLFAAAPDVLTAARPCWAMSPLQVSRLLPASECFDVVIFDEASQVRPADAIPALLRAPQAIIAGDSRQLPPTEFFTKVLEAPSDADDVAEDASLGGGQDGPAKRPVRRTGSFTRDVESILLAFDTLLAGQSRRLQWHYRSRDERLISVSNAGIYQGSLTTFPGADLAEGLRHVVVPPSFGHRGTLNSPDAEVQRVVDLIVEHARTRPEESLGVITFGSPHAGRIEEALESRYKDDPDLEPALAGHGEPFFIKNIERVQGDERDAIILTVGYGKDPLSGRVRLFWGPLLKEGGERRLNVAISRARRRMTLVTSFEAGDIAPDAHSSAGFALMHQFLTFMASGGTDLGENGRAGQRHPLNAFELDIYRRLTDAGLSLEPQLGVGRYRLDFAVRHPRVPTRYVLAIEADGASYHSGHTARERDRLRQRQLESRGWRFHRIWSTDWFSDAEREVDRAVAAYEAALAAPGPDKPSPPVPPQTEPPERPYPRPKIKSGLKIAQYPHDLLVELVRHSAATTCCAPASRNWANS